MIQRLHPALPPTLGNILSEDTFYKDDMAETVELADLGVLGVEMEAAALYYLGANSTYRP